MFLKESNMKRSDKYNININNNNGLISHGDNLSNINVPYSMKLLIQELMTMNIAPRLLTNTIISNEELNNKIIDNIIKE